MATDIAVMPEPVDTKIFGGGGGLTKQFRLRFTAPEPKQCFGLFTFVFKKYDRNFRKHFFKAQSKNNFLQCFHIDSGIYRGYRGVCFPPVFCREGRSTSEHVVHESTQGPPVHSLSNTCCTLQLTIIILGRGAGTPVAITFNSLVRIMEDKFCSPT